MSNARDIYRGRACIKKVLYSGAADEAWHSHCSFIRVFAETIPDFLGMSNEDLCSAVLKQSAGRASVTRFGSADGGIGFMQGVPPIPVGSDAGYPGEELTGANAVQNFRSASR